MGTEVTASVPEMVLPPVVSTLTSHDCSGQLGAGAPNGFPVRKPLGTPARPLRTPPSPPSWAKAVEARSRQATTGRATKRDMDDPLVTCGGMGAAPSEVLR